MFEAESSLRQWVGTPYPLGATYDGTGTFRNDKIVPYLAEARDVERASSPSPLTAPGLR